MSWDLIHTHYTKQDWSKIPSIFATQVILYFQKSGKILEIWAGVWQDSRYFCDSGFDVVSTDFSDKVTHINEATSREQILSWKYKTEVLDISEWTKYIDTEFDIVYVHLSLHYFSEVQMQKIFIEIQRILKKWWIFAILLNTKNDPEYGTGKKIEDDYFEITSIKKRYFDINNAIKYFWKWFELLISDDRWETYKDREKWIHDLIRLVWKKI